MFYPEPVHLPWLWSPTVLLPAIIIILANVPDLWAININWGLLPLTAQRKQQQQQHQQ